LCPKEFRRNWARLIQKIYEVDPLICSRCQGSMRVIAFIEDEDVIKKCLLDITPNIGHINFKWIFRSLVDV